MRSDGDESKSGAPWRGLFRFSFIFSHVFILHNIMCLAPAVFVASTCLSRPIEASL